MQDLVDLDAARQRFNMALLVTFGEAVGLLGAFVLGRFAADFLYAVKPGEPGVFLFGGGFLFSTSVLASAFPAWQATRSEPTAILRQL